MSHPSAAELRLLGSIADEVRDVFSERGYRVDVALEVDSAFTRGSSRGSLVRDLVCDAVGVAAGRVGVDFRWVNGGRELRPFVGSVDRRYRVRRGRRDSRGDLVVTVSENSSLACQPGDSLFEEEPWTFVWTVDGEGQIEELLAAEIVGYVPGSPGRLEMGRLIPLGAGSGGPKRFQTADEDLDFGDRSEGAGESEAS